MGESNVGPLGLNTLIIRDLRLILRQRRGLKVETYGGGVSSDRPALTVKYAFDIHADADIGWITGCTYSPLCNGVHPSLLHPLYTV